MFPFVESTMKSIGQWAIIRYVSFKLCVSTGRLCKRQKAKVDEEINFCRFVVTAFNFALWVEWVIEAIRPVMQAYVRTCTSGVFLPKKENDNRSIDSGAAGKTS